MTCGGDLKAVWKSTLHTSRERTFWEEGTAHAKAPRQEMLGVECCSVPVSGKEGMESVKRRG